MFKLIKYTFIKGKLMENWARVIFYQKKKMVSNNSCI